MRVSTIIKVQIAAERSAGFTDAVVSPQIDFLVFDAAPQPFDERFAPIATGKRTSYWDPHRSLSGRPMSQLGSFSTEPAGLASRPTSVPELTPALSRVLV